MKQRNHHLLHAIAFATLLCGAAMAVWTFGFGSNDFLGRVRNISDQDWEELYKSERSALPLYWTIPAAKASALTPAAAKQSPASKSWSRSNGDSSNSRYSALTQINRSNVGRLEVAWIFHSGDGKGNIQANPVIVDGVMYAPTVGKSIVAINAATGAEIWRFRPPEDLLTLAFYNPSEGKTIRLSPQQLNKAGIGGVGYGPAQRGLIYWPGDAAHNPRLYFMANGYLIALNAKTGKLASIFGQKGRASASKGAGSSGFLGAIAPVILKDVIVTANQNFVEAFDVVKGARRWSFNTLAYPVADSEADNGGNVWGGLALDETRGIVFFAVGDPHPNFIGIDRPGRNLHTNSVVALDVLTGRLLWSFQDIGHDLWDLDIAAPPNLITVTRHGRRVDAVAQVTKLGNTLLLDRVSGRPLFPYRMRRAPLSSVANERTWPYQPDLKLPQPFARQIFTRSDITNISPAARKYIERIVDGAAFGWFEPLREGKPTIYYGVHGGAEWTGAAFNPHTGWLFVSSNDVPYVQSLSRLDADAPQRSLLSPGGLVFLGSCAGCHGVNLKGQGMAPSIIEVNRRLTENDVAHILQNGRNAMPPISLTADEHHDLLAFLFLKDAQSASDAKRSSSPAPSTLYEATNFTKLLDEQGYPGSKPPWGTLNAINLNTGKRAWQVPLGEHQELTARGIAKTGTENFGGAMATAGGLVFCAGTRDQMIRAFDQLTGRELWRHKLPFGGYAPPATYEVNGRQYVVIAATGGGKLGGETGDAYVAFALPK